MLSLGNEGCVCASEKGTADTEPVIREGHISRHPPGGFWCISYPKKRRLRTQPGGSIVFGVSEDDVDASLKRVDGEKEATFSKDMIRMCHLELRRTMQCKGVPVLLRNVVFLERSE